MSEQQNEIRRHLAEHGLEQFEDEVFSCLAPAIFLQRTERTPPDGRYHAGPRDPFLGPLDFEWPTFEGTPMTCSAQINLESLAGVDQWPGPTSGVLSFFDAYAISDTASFGTEGTCLAEVRHFTGEDTFVEHQFPYPQQDLEQDRISEAGYLERAQVLLAQRAHDEWVLPMHQRLANDPISGQIANIVFEVERPLAWSQLMGPPNGIDWNPANQMQRLQEQGLLGANWDDQESNHWDLLFQPWESSGPGHSFFLVPRADLIDGRFDRCWFLWQR